MSAGLTTLFGAVGTVAALLAVLLPVIRAQGASLRRELDALRDTVRGDVAGLRNDVARLDGRVDRLTGDVHALSDRVARIEGALTGPWRPANGTPARQPPSAEAST